MTLTEMFQIDGELMIPPDSDMQMEYNDLDSDDSGRDESGYMHRVVLRHELGTWSFNYSGLTADEYVYMKSLFSGKASFIFTHPSDADPSVLVSTTAYRSKYSVTWHSARTNMYRNYKFNIIEC